MTPYDRLMNRLTGAACLLVFAAVLLLVGAGCLQLCGVLPRGPLFGERGVLVPWRESDTPKSPFRERHPPTPHDAESAELIEAAGLCYTIEEDGERVVWRQGFGPQTASEWMPDGTLKVRLRTPDGPPPIPQAE